MANYLPIAYVGQNPGLNRNQMEKDFTRFDRANSNTPLWGKEGYRNDKIKADMKKEYAEDLKHQVEELRRKKMQKKKTGKDELSLNIGVQEVPQRRVRQVNSSKAAFLAMRNNLDTKNDEKDGLQIKHSHPKTKSKRNSKIPFDVPAGIRRQINAPTSRVIPQVNSRPSSVTDKPGQVPMEKIGSPERRILNKPVQSIRRRYSSEEEKRNKYEKQNRNNKNNKRNRKIIKRSFSYDDNQNNIDPSQDFNNNRYEDMEVAMEQMQSLSFVQKMLVEERAERKKLKDQLDRISSLAERNENTLRDRTAYLEKLRMQDALDMREAKDRLRQVETEILQYKIAGAGRGTSLNGYVNVGSGNNNNNNNNRQNVGIGSSAQLPGGGILPGGRNGRNNARTRAQEQLALQQQQQAQQQQQNIVNNGKQNLLDPARLIAELRARDERDRKYAQEEEKKRTEMWEEMLSMKRHLDEHRTQMSEFALRSADRVASLETRVNMRESSVVRLEEKDSAQIQNLASRDSQIDARYENIYGQVKRLEHLITRERETRRENSNELNAREDEIRKIIDEKEKIMFERVSEKMMEVWRAHTEQRKAEQQLQTFNEERHSNARSSMQSYLDQLKGTLADERADRRQFELEMNRKFEMRVAAIEADNASQRSSTELYEKGMQRDANQAMNELTKLVKRYHQEAEEQKMRWERTYKQGLKQVHDGLDKLRKETTMSSETVENVLRAEIRMREKKMQEGNERAVARETVIDDRAKAVEARILASVKGYDERIKNVEDRVDAALASFKAQMEADLKLNADSTKKALSNMDAALQTLSVRVDANDAESRAAISDIEQVVLEVRALTVSRGELKSTEQRLTVFADNAHEDLGTRMTRIEEFAKTGLRTEREERIAADGKLDRDLGRVQTYLRKNTKDSINELRRETESLLDKERIQRIQGDGATVRAREVAVTTLSTELKEAIINARENAVNSAKEMVDEEAKLRNDAIVQLNDTSAKGREDSLNAAKENTTISIQNLRDELMPKVSTAEEKSIAAEALSKDAQQKIVEVKDTAEKHISTQNNVMNTNFDSEKLKRLKDAKLLTDNVQDRLKKMESSIRRVFEQQLQSVKAYSQANLAAEAAIRLKQGTRIRGEVDERLTSQRDWIVQKTDAQINQFNRKVTRMIMDEAQARKLSSMQLRDAIGQDLDDAVRESEVRTAMEGIIGRLVDKHQDETLNDVSMILTNSLATTSRSIRKQLRESSDDVNAKITKGIDSLRQEMEDDITGRVEELQENAEEYAKTTEERIEDMTTNLDENKEKINELETKITTEVDERTEAMKKEVEERTQSLEELKDTQTLAMTELETKNTETLDAFKQEQEENTDKFNDKLGLLMEAQDKMADAATSRGDKLNSMETMLNDHGERITALEDIQKAQDAEFAEKAEKEKKEREAAEAARKAKEQEEEAARKAKEQEEEAARKKAEEEKKRKEEEEKKKKEAEVVENEWDEVEDEEQGVTKWVNKNTGEETYEKPPGV